jgi:hypothetical protein
LNEALDKVRKSEYARLSGKDRRFIKGLSVTVWVGITLSARWAPGRNECVSAK